MKTWAEIEAIKAETNAKVFNSSNAGEKRVLVGLATCGIAAGASPVYDAFATLAAGNANVKVGQVGCIGMCQYEPIVEIVEPGKPKITYVKMDAEKAKRVYEEHVIGGNVVTDFLLQEKGTPVNSLEDTTFYKLQKRIALRNCGIIDPENIDEYIARDGYAALHKVVTSMTSEDVINTMLDSGLRGRGGAGFPTGRKWSFAAANKAPQKYVCCNADEGDPGAFMDRSVLEGDPHAVLEAMTIAGFAIGATQGYIYVRAEYPVAVKRLNIAIKQPASRTNFRSFELFGTISQLSTTPTRRSSFSKSGNETSGFNAATGMSPPPFATPTAGAATFLSPRFLLARLSCATSPLSAGFTVAAAIIASTCF